MWPSPLCFPGDESGMAKRTERVRGAKGRWLGSGDSVKGSGAGAGTGNAKRMMQKKVKQAWPEITDMLVKTAKGGHVAVAKWIFEVSGLSTEAPKQGKKRRGFAETFMREWKRHQDAATEAAAAAEKTDTETAK